MYAAFEICFVDTSIDIDVDGMRPAGPRRGRGEIGCRDHPIDIGLGTLDDNGYASGRIGGATRQQLRVILAKRKVARSYTNQKIHYLSILCASSGEIFAPDTS